MSQLCHAHHMTNQAFRDVMIAAGNRNVPEGLDMNRGGIIAVEEPIAGEIMHKFNRFERSNYRVDGVLKFVADDYITETHKPASEGGGVTKYYYASQPLIDSMKTYAVISEDRRLVLAKNYASTVQASTGRGGKGTIGLE